MQIKCCQISNKWSNGLKYITVDLKDPTKLKLYFILSFIQI